MRPGPYPRHHAGPGVLPDDGRSRSEGRDEYENSQSPWQTDELNEQFIARPRAVSPLGDPVPFSAYLIGQLGTTGTRHSSTSTPTARTAT